MNKGTPKSIGRLFPFLANVTAVVMMKPQPIANNPPLIGPTAKRPSSMFCAEAWSSKGESRANKATNRQPKMFPTRIKPKSLSSPFFMNPAVPV